MLQNTNKITNRLAQLEIYSLLAYVALGLYLITGIVKSSYVVSYIQHIDVGYYVAFLFMLVSFIADNSTHEPKHLIILLIVSIIGVIEYAAGGKVLLFMILLAYVLRREKPAAVITFTFILTAALFALILLLSNLGVISHIVATRGSGGVGRNSLGFLSWTYPSKILMSLTLMILFLERGLIRLPAVALILIANVYIFSTTNTRNGFFIVFLALIYTLIMRVLNHKGANDNNPYLGRFSLSREMLACAIWWVLLALSCYLVYTYDPFDIFYSSLDNTLSYRLSYTQGTLEQTGIPLFGQSITFDETQHVVDSSYLRMVLDYGLFGTLVTLISLSSLSLKCVLSNQSTLFFILMLYAVYCCFDPNILTIYINPFFILLFNESFSCIHEPDSPLANLHSSKSRKSKAGIQIERL